MLLLIHWRKSALSFVLCSFWVPKIPLIRRGKCCWSHTKILTHPETESVHHMTEHQCEGTYIWQDQTFLWRSPCLSNLVRMKRWTPWRTAWWRRRPACACRLSPKILPYLRQVWCSAQSSSRHVSGSGQMKEGTLGNVIKIVLGSSSSH